MKKILLLWVLLIASVTAHAETVYVNGTLHNLAKSDFVKSGNDYTAYIDVIGDYGQQLIFDIDATVGGRGSQQITEREYCVFWLDRDRIRCAEWDYYQIVSKDFRYVAELKVTCSGIAIGSDMDNKNELVNGVVSNRYREVKLLSDKRLSTGGHCQQLKVEVKGLELAAIDNIDLDVLIAEVF